MCAPLRNLYNKVMMSRRLDNMFSRVSITLKNMLRELIFFVWFGSMTYQPLEVI